MQTVNVPRLTLMTSLTLQTTDDDKDISAPYTVIRDSTGEFASWFRVKKSEKNPEERREMEKEIENILKTK